MWSIPKKENFVRWWSINSRPWILLIASFLIEINAKYLKKACNKNSQNGNYLSDDGASILDCKCVWILLIASFLNEINAKYLPKSNILPKSKFGYYWCLLFLYKSHDVMSLLISIYGGAQSLCVWRACHKHVTSVTPSQTWDMPFLIHNTAWQPI